MHMSQTHVPIQAANTTQVHARFVQTIIILLHKKPQALLIHSLPTPPLLPSFSTFIYPACSTISLITFPFLT
jgi:hypothetical protein